MYLSRLYLSAYKPLKRRGEQKSFKISKGLTVTPAGEKIIQFANDVTLEQERIRENIDELEGEIHGTLKLAVASIIGQHWLPKVLKTYVEKYPNAKISLITGWSSEMLKSLYEDQVHIGIIRGNPEWKGRKDYLMTDHLYLVDTEISCIEDIAHTERPFIQFKSDSTYFQEIQHWWHQNLKRRRNRRYWLIRLKRANRWRCTESVMPFCRLLPFKMKIK